MTQVDADSVIFSAQMTRALSLPPAPKPNDAAGTSNVRTTRVMTPSPNSPRSYRATCPPTPPSNGPRRQVVAAPHRPQGSPPLHRAVGAGTSNPGDARSLLGGIRGLPPPSALRGDASPAPAAFPQMGRTAPHPARNAVGPSLRPIPASTSLC